MQGENEFRVRAVKRYVVTHFTSDGHGHGKCRQLGEYPNIDQADEVGQALAASVSGATFATIADRREPLAERYSYTSQEADELMALPIGTQAG